MNEFEGKTAVITGAASGIGKALAERFAKEKMQVVLADIEEEALEKTVESLRQYQHRVIGVKTDVLVEESIKELFAKATEEYGNVHILCNNAGIGANSGNKAIWEIENYDWDWVMGVNYQGVLQGIQTFLPHMIEHGEDGHVVTTVSMAGLLPGAGTYGVSKHAVMALTEALSRDLINRNTKINASVLCPGFVDTRLTKKNTFKMPLVMSASKAAALTLYGLKNGRFETHFPKRMSWFFKFINLLPLSIYLKLMGNLR